MTTYNVSGGTTMTQQMAITQSVVGAMQSGDNTWAVNAPAGDQAGAVIAQTIVQNAQASISSSPGGSTQSSQGTPSVWDNFLTALSASGGAGGVASGAASQAAAAGSSPGSVAESAGGGNPTSLAAYGQSANAANAVNTSALSWLQSNLANYGLVILGVVLGVGALLVSQKSTIVNVGKTAAKVAAL